MNKETILGYEFERFEHSNTVRTSALSPGDVFEMDFGKGEGDELFIFRFWNRGRKKFGATSLSTGKQHTCSYHQPVSIIGKEIEKVYEVEKGDIFFVQQKKITQAFRCTGFEGNKLLGVTATGGFAWTMPKEMVTGVIKGPVEIL